MATKRPNTRKPSTKAYTKAELEFLKLAEQDYGKKWTKQNAESYLAQVRAFGDL
jgi:hypothetical protein